MKSIFSILAICFVTGCYAQHVNTLPDWALGGFTRPARINPVISPDSTTLFDCPMLGAPVRWESNDTFNPAAVVKDGKIVVLYRAEDKSGVKIGTRTSRLGYAESSDGLHFKRNKVPVLFPGNDNQKEWEWPGGIEDPRVAVTADGTYVLFYTQWNRKVARLGVATSKDLKDWKKWGPIFKNAYNGKFHDTWSKSASILTKVENGKQVIAKVDGKYWMYWGENAVHAATSDDLVNWAPVTEADGSLKSLMKTRPGYFDSDLTECGPPAIWTEKGIVLLYNGKNNGGQKGDKRFTPNSYCAGQALFDSKDPSRLIARLDVPFFRPMEPFEKSGQYVNGTVFIEGLVFYQKKWFLYYGCADSKVGVAIYDPAKRIPGDVLP